MIGRPICPMHKIWANSLADEIKCPSCPTMMARLGASILFFGGEISSCYAQSSSTDTSHQTCLG